MHAAAVKPPYFHLRLTGLLALASASSYTLLIGGVTGPILIGRPILESQGLVVSVGVLVGVLVGS